jgi:hypothetical protein
MKNTVFPFKLYCDFQYLYKNSFNFYFWKFSLVQKIKTNFSPLATAQFKEAVSTGADF